MVEAKELVAAWATPWPCGATAAVVSALDVLVGDVVEDEERERPDIVIADGRIELDAISPWTNGWPGRTGLGERIFGRQRKRLIERLGDDAAQAAARVAAWKKVGNELGDIPWTAIADMEVVSLAMGHFGPARQPTALPVISSFLVAVAAAFAGASVESIAPFTVPAAANVIKYEAAFAGIARTSARAIEELGRRAKLQDPFARPIRSYLPLLGGTLV